MKYYSQATVFAAGSEAEYHNCASTVAEILTAISDQIRLDHGSAPIDSLNIQIYKDTLDGED